MQLELLNGSPFHACVIVQTESEESSAQLSFLWPSALAQMHEPIAKRRDRIPTINFIDSICYIYRYDINLEIQQSVWGNEQAQPQSSEPRTTFCEDCGMRWRLSGPAWNCNNFCDGQSFGIRMWNAVCLLFFHYTFHGGFPSLMNKFGSPCGHVGSTQRRIPITHEQIWVTMWPCRVYTKKKGQFPDFAEPWLWQKQSESIIVFACIWLQAFEYKQSSLLCRGPYHHHPAAWQQTVHRWKCGASLAQPLGMFIGVHWFVDV